MLWFMQDSQVSSVVSVNIVIWKTDWRQMQVWDMFFIIRQPQAISKSTVAFRLVLFVFRWKGFCTTTTTWDDMLFQGTISDQRLTVSG